MKKFFLVFILFLFSFSLTYSADNFIVDNESHNDMFLIVNGSNENVGIGINSPDTKLHIKDEGTVLAIDSINSLLKLQFSDNSIARSYLGAGVSHLFMVTDIIPVISFVVDSLGRVGIGTSTPGEELDVVGNISATGDICISGGNCVSDLGGGSSIDYTPDQFSFTNKSLGLYGVEQTSNIITLSDFDISLLAEVSGSGSPLISVNEGDWVTKSLISVGDTVRLKMTTSSTPGLTYFSTLSIADNFFKVWSIFSMSEIGNGMVSSYQKISDLEGNFTETLDNEDFFGSYLANIGDLDGDGINDLGSCAYQDGDGGTSRGAGYILFMNTDGTVSSSQKISDTQGNFTETLDNTDRFCSGITGIGDLDGDGILDIAIGSQLDDDGGTDRGAVYILFMNADGTVSSSQKISDTQGNFLETMANGDKFGSNVENIGDLDGDEITDLAVGAYGDDDGGSENGAVYVLFMNTDGTVSSSQMISESQGNFSVNLDTTDHFGWDIASLGDLDGDGIIDLAVSARLDDDGGTNRGAVYILFMNSDGTVSSTQKISDTAGNFIATFSNEDYLGISIANIGDLNNDGVTDLATNYRSNDGGSLRGGIYILFMNTDGTVKSHSPITDTQGGFTGTLDNVDVFGMGLSDIGDLDGDGILDIVAGALYDDDGGTNRGAAYVLFMDKTIVSTNSFTFPTTGNVSSSQKISDTEGNFLEILESNDNFAYDLTDIGDLDGDGVTDLLVGAYLDDDGGTDRGAVYVLFMNTDGTVRASQKISDTEGNFTATLNNNDRFGSSVSDVGDLDGDGVNDLAVGARNDDDGSTDHGAIYILFMNTDGTVSSSQKISDTQGNFTETFSVQDRFGTSITNIGDLDGDGIIDLGVGTFRDDDGGSDRGAVYVLFMNTDGTVSSSQKISDTQGNFTETLGDNDQFGRSIGSIGDLDGDGINDILVGSTNDDDGGSDRGAVYVLFMNTDGTVSSSQKISDTQGNFIATLDNSDRFGSSFSDVGDLDNDGINDLVVGAYLDDDGGTDRGSIYLLFMNTNGTVRSYKKISDITGNFTETLDNGDSFGISTSSIGDLDNDGVIDLVVGSFGDDDGGTDRGAIYVLFMERGQVAGTGEVDSFQKISDTEGNFTETLDNEDFFGSTLTNIGDLDGDGIDDLGSCAYQDGDGGTSRGAGYILFMNSDGTVSSSQKISDTTGNFTETLDNTDRFCSGITGIGDLDGDGILDVAVGAQLDDDGATDSGAVYILFLNTDGTVSSSQKISDTQGNFSSFLATGDKFGANVENIGDLDGDGITDLAVGTYGDDDGGAENGAFYVLFLNTDGTVSSSQMISESQGNFSVNLDTTDHFGWDIASLGDLDGDGIIDLAVSARLDDDGGTDRGAVYVLFMNTDGTVSSTQKISDTEGNFLETFNNEDYLGLSITNIGDVDFDGITDLSINFRSDDGGTDRGGIYILFMNSDGTVKSSNAITDTRGGFTGTLDNVDVFGSSITEIGDLDGNGVVDLAVSATYDDDGGSNRGAVYILFMERESTIVGTGGTIITNESYTSHIFTTNATFSVNQDAQVDILVVAGGGGGGNNQAGGGGGGAGGLIYRTSHQVYSNQTYSVVVGSGGAAIAPSVFANGGDGGDSSFDNYTATGGGGGGNYYAAGSTGGSGGGGTDGAGPGSGTSGQGNSGGTGTASLGNEAGGGGGGAGASGGNAIPNYGGAGGVGLQYNISGTTTYYAGGGGGAINSVSITPGSGGLGGGGIGGKRAATVGGNGTANTGGGGGGGGWSTYGSGAGGSGIVVIRYPS